VIVLTGTRVALIQETNSHQAGGHWTIPSGLVEQGESAAAGACRELMEEAGLAASPSDLRLASRSRVVAPGGPDTLAFNFVLLLEDEAPLLAAEAGIADARWVPVGEAVSRLREHPYRPLVDPVVEILTGGWTTVYEYVYDPPSAPPSHRVLVDDPT